jgi:hypothetical protein
MLAASRRAVSQPLSVEAADHHAGDAEKRESDGDFADDEAVAQQAGGASGSGAARLLLQGADHVAAGGEPGRQQAE